MPLSIKQEDQSRLLLVTLTGKLQKSDYALFVPELEILRKSLGKLRILVEMQDFHGWTLGALWEDLKFDLKHFLDIERVALVGDQKWEKGLASFCKPFTAAEVRYFDASKREEAFQWIRSV